MPSPVCLHTRLNQRARPCVHTVVGITLRHRAFAHKVSCSAFVTMSRACAACKRRDWWSVMGRRLQFLLVPVSLLAATLLACGGNGGVTVSVSPSKATLSPGESQEFTAVVAGAADDSVVWSASGGTVAASGLIAAYTAPMTVGEYTVTATRAGGASESATALVQVIAGDVAEEATAVVGPEGGYAELRDGTRVMIPANAGIERLVVRLSRGVIPSGPDMGLYADSFVRVALEDVEGAVPMSYIVRFPARPLPDHGIVDLVRVEDDVVTLVGVATDDDDEDVWWAEVPILAATGTDGVLASSGSGNYTQYLGLRQYVKAVMVFDRGPDALRKQVQVELEQRSCEAPDGSGLRVDCVIAMRGAGAPLEAMAGASLSASFSVSDDARELARQAADSFTSGLVMVSGGAWPTAFGVVGSLSTLTTLLSYVITAMDRLQDVISDGVPKRTYGVERVAVEAEGWLLELDVKLISWQNHCNFIDRDKCSWVQLDFRRVRVDEHVERHRSVDVWVAFSGWGADHTYRLQTETPLDEIEGREFVFPVAVCDGKDSCPRVEFSTIALVGTDREFFRWWVHYPVYLVANVPGAPPMQGGKVLLAPSVIGAGEMHSLAVRSDGSIWAWGSNAHGELGDGTDEERHTPVRLSGLSNVSSVATEWVHSLALRDDGTVWAWGDNEYGQLGDGTTTARTSPVRVSELSDITAIAVGGSHSLALRNDGRVWAWGMGGRLGDGTNADRPVPVPVIGLDNVVAIDAGSAHSLALRSDGSVWAWGVNGGGQLGDGSTTTRLTPVQVSGVSGATVIAAGGAHSLAVLANGTVWAWGWNEQGQLGDSTSTHRMTPVRVSGLNEVKHIAAGLQHSLAALADGSVWAWGWNYAGQLGDGTSTRRLTPARVSGLGGVGRVAGGAAHSLAVRDDGTVWAWGGNSRGQLGDGTSTGRLVPVRVSGLAGVTVGGVAPAIEFGLAR